MRHTVRTSVKLKHLYCPMLGVVASLRRSRHRFPRHYIYYGETFDEHLFWKLIREDSIINSYETNFLHIIISFIRCHLAHYSRPVVYVSFINDLELICYYTGIPVL